MVARVAAETLAAVTREAVSMVALEARMEAPLEVDSLDAVAASMEAQEEVAKEEAAEVVHGVVTMVAWEMAWLPARCERRGDQSPQERDQGQPADNCVRCKGDLALWRRKALTGTRSMNSDRRGRCNCVT